MTKLIYKKEPSYISKHVPFDYQQEAFNDLKDLEYAGIFHEQGLGKSKIVLDIILYWIKNEIIDTVLLVAKKGLIPNWEREIKNHTHIVPQILSQNKQKNYYSFTLPSRIILTNYEVIISESKRLKTLTQLRDMGIVLDESTKIKNPNSRLTKAFFEISCNFKRKIIMTGTPIANRAYDIWAQIFFLDKGNSLGNDFSKFKKENDLQYDFDSDEEKRIAYEKSIQNIYKSISNFSIRETKDKKLINLPRKNYKFIYSDWERLQYDKYCQVLEEEQLYLLSENEINVDNIENILKKLLRLIQITSNPLIIDDSYEKESGKYDILMQIVRNIINNNEKCIIWSSFIKNVDYLQRKLLNYGAVKVHGSLKYDTRNKNIEKFMFNEKNKILIATPGAAKEGLTLTMANHVIFYDRSFKLDDYLQAQDRIHRISQEKLCYIYNIIMKDSIEEWIDILLKAKELSQKLAMKDITYEDYKKEINYSMKELIKNILNTKEQ